MTQPNVDTLVEITDAVRGCDLWTFRDGLVTKKDSFWKIVEPLQDR